MQSRDFVIWAEDEEEATYISETLDKYMERYGTGRNIFRVSIIPGTRCPFDSVGLSDRAEAILQRQFVITEDK